MPKDLPAQISKEEANIVAHICGDGYLSSYLIKRTKADLLVHPRKNIYRRIYLVGYCNTSEVLLSGFKESVLKVYGLKTQFQKGNTLTFAAKWVYERLQSFGTGRSHDWFISDKILGSNKEVLVEWLKAFFDDESHVDLSRKRICINSVNECGLQQVQYLLTKLGITSTKFYGPYYYKECKFYRLTIFKKSLEEYAKLVGFNHPDKIKALEILAPLAK